MLNLGGCICIFTPKIGEDFQFDVHIFLGWVDEKPATSSKKTMKFEIVIYFINTSGGDYSLV